jgi:hypothetical protein
LNVWNGAEESEKRDYDSEGNSNEELFYDYDE